MCYSRGVMHERSAAVTAATRRVTHPPMPFPIRLALAAALALAPTGPVRAQATGAPDMPATIRAVPLTATDELRLDGVLDEPFWSQVPPATDFRQRDPDAGAPATERTEVRIVYESRRIVIGVHAFDSEPDRLLGNQMQRDQPFSSDDRFMWTLDPFLDGRSGYFFEINPSGAMGDGLITSPTGGFDLGGEINKSWDGIWTARVRRTATGWTAEIEIPFNTLSFNPDADAWGINFQRTVRRKNEESLWTGWLRTEGLARMSNAGRLVGLQGISQGIGLDIKPYAVGALAAAPGRGEPATTGSADAGVDLFYNITPALRLDLTVNTDFAETEVDERQVNLTRFPLRFPEKREFFLDGSSYLNFPSTAEPYFSRRIGIAAGRPQRILAGTKLTGQVGAQDIGLLHVRTGDDEGAAGEDFTVARVRRRFGSQSYIGGLYTRRALVDDAAGVDARHTVGADLTLGTPDFLGRLVVDTRAWWLRTSRTDDETGGTTAYGMSIDLPNDPWSLEASFDEVQEAYDPAVGFLRQQDFREWATELAYNPRFRDHAVMRGLEFSVEAEVQTDLAGTLITRQLQFMPLELQFNSGDRVAVEIFHTTEQLDEDFEISDGVRLPLGSRYAWTRQQVQIDTAERRPLQAWIEYSRGGFFSGSRQEWNVSITARPRPGFLLQLSSEYNQIDLAEGSFITRVHRFDARTQFSPWMSLANNLQWDSESRALGWQLRFRWILKPGDDVFVVYTHNWLDDLLGDGRYRTLDRQAAMKITRTWRF